MTERRSFQRANIPLQAVNQLGSGVNTSPKTRLKNRLHVRFHLLACLSPSSIPRRWRRQVVCRLQSTTVDDGLSRRRSRCPCLNNPTISRSSLSVASRLSLLLLLLLLLPVTTTSRRGAPPLPAESWRRCWPSGNASTFYHGLPNLA